MAIDEIPESSSSVAAICNIRIKLGDSFSRVFEYFSDEDFTVPRDISGSDFQFIIINAKTKTEVVSIGIGAELEISDTNELSLNVSDENKAKIHCGTKYIYKVKETTADDVLITIQEGDLIVE